MYMHAGKKKQKVLSLNFPECPLKEAKKKKKTSERYTVCTITSCFPYWLVANVAQTYCLFGQHVELVGHISYA